MSRRVSASNCSLASFMSLPPWALIVLPLDGQSALGGKQKGRLAASLSVEMGEGRTPRPRPLPRSRLRAWSAIFCLEIPSAHRRALGVSRLIFLSPPISRSADCTFAFVALPGPRRGDREDAH